MKVHVPIFRQTMFHLPQSIATTPPSPSSHSTSVGGSSQPGSAEHRSLASTRESAAVRSKVNLAESYQLAIDGSCTTPTGNRLFGNSLRRAYSSPSKVSSITDIVYVITSWLGEVTMQWSKEFCLSSLCLYLKWMVKTCDDKKRNINYAISRSVVTRGKEPCTGGPADLLSVVATSQQKETTSSVTTDE